MKGGDESRFAAALKYSRGVDNAPRVTAKGRGELAERIIGLAKKEGVPLREDKDLASILAFTEVGDEIPPEIYMVVAEIFAFLYKINGDMKKGGMDKQACP